MSEESSEVNKSKGAKKIRKRMIEYTTPFGGKPSLGTFIRRDKETNTPWQDTQQKNTEAKPQENE